MLNWIKKLFYKCEHDLEITRKQITLKRWNPDWDNSNSEYEADLLGHWSYHKATEINMVCKKCGWHNWYTE